MLSKEQYKLLKSIQKRDKARDLACESDEDFEYLNSLELVSLTAYKAEDENICFAHITEKGKAYIYTHRKESLAKWIPYTITTVIAVAAFIKSFFA